MYIPKIYGFKIFEKKGSKYQKKINIETENIVNVTNKINILSVT